MFRNLDIRQFLFLWFFISHEQIIVQISIGSGRSVVLHVERTGICNMIDNSLTLSNALSRGLQLILLELLIQRFVLVNDLGFGHVVHHILKMLVFLGLYVFIVSCSLRNHLEVILHFFIEVFLEKVALITWVHRLQGNIHHMVFRWLH